MPYEKSGGKQCVVVGCTNSQKKRFDWNNKQCSVHGMLHKDCPCLEPYKFHCIPSNVEKRRVWIRALNRKEFNPSSKALVCSIHFVDGKLTKENPIPTLHMGYSIKSTPARRPLVRKFFSTIHPKRHVPLSTRDEVLIATKVQDDIEDVILNEPVQCESVCCTNYPVLCRNRPTMVDTATQTVDVVQLDHNYFYSKKTKTSATHHCTSEFCLENISTDSDSRFYTGLSLTVLLSLVTTLSPFGSKLPFKMKSAEQILSVLVRLRLGLSYQDLARRLNVSAQLTNDIFHSWIDIMAQHLSQCVVWLPRETIKGTLPQSFSDSFPRTTCIIDCSEIFIQRPFKIKARAKTWSTYKNNNTAKFAPNGFIMFVSALYGGRASDVYITKTVAF